MSRHRHSDENRVTPETPARARLTLEVLRRRATRRKLVLLECGIIRHAPFADCGRPTPVFPRPTCLFKGPS